MAGALIIARLDDLPLERFAEMLAESEASGYRFLRRVVSEWENGVNRFARPGEALLVAETNGRWVGICGLSIDPYLEDPLVGRVPPMSMSWPIAADLGSVAGSLKKPSPAPAAVLIGFASAESNHKRRGSTNRSGSARAAESPTARMRWS